MTSDRRVASAYNNEITREDWNVAQGREVIPTKNVLVVEREFNHHQEEAILIMKAYHCICLIDEYGIPIRPLSVA